MVLPMNIGAEGVEATIKLVLKCDDDNRLLALSVQSWTKSYVQWSPLGTYLATVHQQGVAVWGGASTFKQLMRYAHKEVFFLFIYYMLL